MYAFSISILSKRIVRAVWRQNRQRPAKTPSSYPGVLSEIYFWLQKLKNPFDCSTSFEGWRVGGKSDPIISVIWFSVGKKYVLQWTTVHYLVTITELAVICILKSFLERGTCEPVTCHAAILPLPPRSTLFTLIHSAHTEGNVKILVKNSWYIYYFFCMMCIFRERNVVFVATICVRQKQEDI